MSDWSSNFDLLTRTAGASTGKVDETYYTNENYKGEQTEKVKDNSTLTFEDMLLLMVTQLQNQTIDNQADTNDMMNQLIQMTVMQAMTTMTTQMEELATANVMSYSASLVGKEVTLGLYDEDGNVTEKVGIVQGSGTYDGMPVIFVDGESYFLSSIMAVGRLPEKKPEEGEKPDEGEDGGTTEGGGSTEGSGGVEGGGSTEGAENSGAAGEASGTPGSGENENENEDGETEVAGTNGTAGI